MEIGVAYGEFSEELCKKLLPKKFFACDIFQFHNMKHALGRDPSNIFNGLTHAEYFEKRLSNLVSDFEIITGDSSKVLLDFPSKSLDLIYVDGNHNYDVISKDVTNTARILSEDGLLIFNDYVRWDPFLNAEYGVVLAVNQLLAIGDWEIVGFAFQRDMFCDIALKRKSQDN
jgi:SAM-dependent methyltransferase